jgi:4-amino-4-deoxy-L-arabinose transferase-like glycosyltransferase
MSGATVRIALGSLLALAGILVPSATLIEVLRVAPAELQGTLLLGADLFRGGLVLLGVLVVALARASLWKSDGLVATRQPDPEAKAVRPLLAVVLLAAAALRLYGLEAGLWYDEIVTYVKYARLPFGEIVSTYDTENQHPLYSILAHAAFSIFGESGWSLRLPAALFGVGSIWALYLLGREVGSRREGLLAAALLTVSYHHMWFSQNARGYTGLLFWTTLSSWVFLRALREGRPGLWLAYAATAALGVYTHMTMLFVMAGQLIAYGIALASRRRDGSRDRWTGLLLGFPLAGLLSLQLHALVLPQMVEAIRRTESVVPTWRRPLWTLLEFAQGLQIGFSGGAVAVGALLVCGAGLWSFWRTNPAVVQLLVLPPVIGGALVVAAGHHLWPRFFFFALGFAALVVVRGTTVLGGVAARLAPVASPRAAAVGTVLSLGLIAAAAVPMPKVYAPKQDFEGALVFVERGRQPGDAVVTVGLATFPYSRFYKTQWQTADSVEALEAIRSRALRTWVVYTLPAHLESVLPELMAGIQRDFSVLKAFGGTLRGGTVVVCRADGGLAGSGSPVVVVGARAAEASVNR